jgi:hypothetical protein
MWLPDWVYRTLPFIYSCSGFLCFYFSENWIGYVPGALLLTAGVMVWKLRKEFKEVRTVNLRS